MVAVVLGIAGMVGGAAVAGAAGFAIGTLSYAIVSGIVAAGISYFGAKALGLTPEAPDVSEFANKAKGLLLNKQANDTFLPVIYGRRRVGGTIVYLRPSGADNKYLNIVLVLCEGEIHDVSSLYLNDISLTEGGFENNVYFEVYTGTDDQVASAELITQSSGEWTANHRLRGVAYVYVRLTYSADLFPSGLPNITCDVVGKNIYDTRTSSNVFLNNPAMCIRDYLTNTRYGRGLDASLIDDDSFEAAADYCDEYIERPNITTSAFVVLNNSIGFQSNKYRYEALYPSGIETAYIEFKTTSFFQVKVASTEEFKSLQTGTRYYLTFSINSEFNSLYVLILSGTTASNNLLLLFQKIDNNGTPINFEFPENDYLSNSFISNGEWMINLKKVPVGVEIKTYCTHSISSQNIEVSLPLSAQGSATMLRYDCNGVVDTEIGSIDILNKLLTSCRGMLVFSGGKYKLIIDKPETPVFEFNEDNIIGQWSIALGGKQTRYNRLKAQFYNPNRNWQSDVAVIDSEEFRVDDNGLLLVKDVELPFTSDYYKAQEIALIGLNASRYQTNCSFTATIEALRCEIGDVVYLTHSTPGWNQKEFRIINLKLKNNDEVEVTCIEYSVDVYDFELVQVDPTPTTSLPNPFDNTPPTDFLWTLDKYGQFGIGKFTWIAPENAFVEYYKLVINADPYTTGEKSEAQRQGISREFIVYGTEYTITDLPQGDYTVYLMSVSTYGALSQPVEETFTVPQPPIINRVSGLEIDNGSDGDNNSETWEGPDVRIVWRPASIQYAYDINDEEPQGAESGTPDWYLKDYQVEVYNAAGDLLRREFVTDTWYVYTYAKNADDAAKHGDVVYRELGFKVWARGKQNQISEQAAIL